MAKSHAKAAQLRQVLRLFSLFGHPMRVVVLQRLARTPTTAGELARGLPVSRTAIVQHLKLLESAGLVVAAQDGRRKIYGIRPDGLAPLARWIDEHSQLAVGRPRAQNRAHARKGNAHRPDPTRP
jgi:DNA-binding transcriptional ArsR family regulator